MESRKLSAKRKKKRKGGANRPEKEEGGGNCGLGEQERDCKIHSDVCWTSDLLFKQFQISRATQNATRVEENCGALKDPRDFSLPAP